MKFLSNLHGGIYCGNKGLGWNGESLRTSIQSFFIPLQLCTEIETRLLPCKRRIILGYWGRRLLGRLWSSDPIIPSNLANLISLVFSVDEWALQDSVPTSEEILVSLKSLGSIKAPGPDGLLALFFKEYWYIIFPKVIFIVQDFFNVSQLLRSLNHAFIVLIPKVENLHRVNHYHPISLCNVYYKVISKIIATY